MGERWKRKNDVERAELLDKQIKNSDDGRERDGVMVMAGQKDDSSTE